MRRSLALWLAAALLCGCATRPFEPPVAFDDSALRSRAETGTGEDVRVSAAIPTREESLAIFGVDLEAKGIQPVWLEVENRTDLRLRFLPTGLDPEYFSPLEVAFGYHKQFSPESRPLLDEHFDRLNFRDPVSPSQSVSGFVFTNLDEGTKIVNVDLVGRKWSESVTVVVPTPGDPAADEYFDRLDAMSTGPGAVSARSHSELRTLLEGLPCCTVNEADEQTGPLNVVLIGRLETFGTALQRRGYRAAPLRPAFALGRRHDLAGTKRARWVPAQPHQLRLWLTEIRFRGQPVWVGQVVTPRGGRFAPAPAGESQAMDPNVDEARTDLVQDLIFSQRLAWLGFVKGAGEEPAAAATGSASPAFRTDGLRGVFVIGDDELALTELRLFDWERLEDD